MIRGALLCLAIALLAPAAGAGQPRSSSEVRAFRTANPCPATSRTRGACPGWQVDHVQPLCAGGPDKPGNMQWLTVEEHKRKTKRDVMHCRLERKKP